MKSQDDLVPSLMQSRVLDAIEKLLGASLTAVNYWCLQGEADESQICSPDFYLGGEVELAHTNSDSSIRITWDENAGFDEHFSVTAVIGSAFRPDTLEVFNASECPVWRDHIGQDIQSVRLFGSGGVPFVVVLEFASGGVSIGNSSHTRFGSGDDVFIETFDLHSRAMKGLSQMWSSK